MRLSALSTAALSCILAAPALAQSHFSDEQRQELRKMLREEIRAALKEMHAAPQAPATTPMAFAKAEGKKGAFLFQGKPTTTTSTTAKAYKMVDGKLHEVKLGDGAVDFTMQVPADGKALMEKMEKSLRLDTKGPDVWAMEEPKSGQRMLTLRTADGADHRIELPARASAPKAAKIEKIDVVEKQALAECCEAVKAAAECCEAVKEAGECKAGECEAAECIEVVAQPVQGKAAKKAKKKGEKKSKKAKAGDAPTKSDDVTERKINVVVEKLLR